MADFNEPIITGNYTTFLTKLRDSISSVAKMFDGTSDTNLPTGAIKWSSTNSRFEKWSGSVWGELDTLYEISVRKLNGSESTAFEPAIGAKGSAFNKAFGAVIDTVCQGNDSRLSDARTPASHNNTYHSVNYAAEAITLSTGIGLSGGGDLTASRSFSIVFGTTATSVCVGDDSRLSDARTPTAHGLDSHTACTLAALNTDITDATLIDTADSRLSDARTPITHNNTYHSATYITSASVTYETLNTNSDVGTGATQVAQGNHVHGSISTAGAIGITANLPIITTTAGALAAGAFGAAVNTFCQGNDSRLSDARTPTAHDLDSHNACTLAELSADITDATLINTTDSRLSDARTPTAHGLDSHNSCTLAALNADISDATLIDTADSRLSDARTPTAHGLDSHNSCTLAALNADISDATLIDTADSRLSDARTPTAHGLDSHTACTLAALNADITGSTLIDTGDSRLSDARTPVSHNNTYHSATYITSASVTYETLNTNSDVGTGAGQLAIGNHAHGNVTNTGYIGVTANLPIITSTLGILAAGAFGTLVNTFCQGNDSRLSDARTPAAHGLDSHTACTLAALNTDITDATLINTTDSRLSDARTPITHGNTYHSATYITSASVTYETLNTNSDVGTGATQVARGNHAHGSITSAGAVGVTANLPLITTTSGVIIAGAFGNTINTFCMGNDTRLYDARPPGDHNLGSHTSATLAQLNSIVSDATLIDTGDSRLSDARTPTAHGLATHSSCTLAELNADITDATLINTTDSRLSDARTPTAHGLDSHTACTLAALNADITGSTLIDTTDSRLSDARTPTTHGNTYHSSAYITTTGVTYEALNTNSDVGAGATQVARGNHAHGSITSAGAIGVTANLPIITTTAGALAAGAFGTLVNTFCQGNDSRLSDARTPVSHNNTYHSATYITTAGVTYEALNTNSDVGTGATQVARGNHTHSYLASVLADTSPQLGGDLDLNGHEIKLDTTPATDHTASGLKGDFVNGNAGSVAFGDVCYMAADGDLNFVDADAIATGLGLFMALATITTTSTGEWLMMGVARDDTWAWTVGGVVYCSLTGTTGNTLTQTRPSATSDVVFPIGIATHADRIYFNPGFSWVEVA